MEFLFPIAILALESQLYSFRTGLKEFGQNEWIDFVFYVQGSEREVHHKEQTWIWRISGEDLFFLCQ